MKNIHTLMWRPFLSDEEEFEVEIDLNTIAMIQAPRFNYRTVTHGYQTSATLRISFNFPREDLVINIVDGVVMHSIQRVNREPRPSEKQLQQMYRNLVAAWRLAR